MIAHGSRLGPTGAIVTVDVAAVNSNVGQFTVAQPGKFLHDAPKSLPMLNEADSKNFGLKGHSQTLPPPRSVEERRWKRIGALSQKQRAALSELTPSRYLAPAS